MQIHKCVKDEKCSCSKRGPKKRGTAWRGDTRADSSFILRESKITETFICRFYSFTERMLPRSPDATKRDSSLRMCGMHVGLYTHGTVR